MITRKLRWGIISTGKIARTFARSLAQSNSGELVSVSWSLTDDVAEPSDQGAR